ncbi:MAG: DUF1289 domain-containing protein [Alteromonadaceae bacterium]|nr:DUF1289 domain-containing protein [Alteromonadaceae bacterium]
MNLNQQAIASPCIRHCCLDNEDVCLGCYRTLEEIVEWGTAPQSRQRVILQNCEQRRDIVANQQIKA